jgi:tellurite resistance protein TerC
VFAILGLRSLFFVLAGMLNRFVYLKRGLAIVLGFVGAKLILLDTVKIPALVSLLVVVGVLAGSVLLSLRQTAGRVKTRTAASSSPVVGETPP